MRRLAIAYVLLVTACNFSPDYGNSSYHCSNGVCPAGFHCGSNQVCVRDGVADAARDASSAADAAAADASAADAAADAAAGVDAGVCEQAAAAADNDSCTSPPINLSTAAKTSAGATAYGNTTKYANNQTLPNVMCTGSTTAGPDAYYEIDMTAGQTVTVTLSPQGWNGAVYLLDQCAVAANCLAGDDEMPNDSFSYKATTDGSYFLVVDGPSSADSGCYTLHVRVK